MFQVLPFTHDYDSRIKNYMKNCRQQLSADYRSIYLKDILVLQYG